MSPDDCFVFDWIAVKEPRRWVAILLYFLLCIPNIKKYFENLSCCFHFLYGVSFGRKCIRPLMYFELENNIWRWTSLIIIIIIIIFTSVFVTWFHLRKEGSRTVAVVEQLVRFCCILAVYSFWGVFLLEHSVGLHVDTFSYMLDWK